MRGQTLTYGPIERRARVAVGDRPDRCRESLYLNVVATVVASIEDAVRVIDAAVESHR